MKKSPAARVAGYSLGIVVAWIALCLIWGSTWLAIKVGLRDLPPFWFCSIRFVIASAVLLAICVGRFEFPKKLSDYAFLAFTGLLIFGINYGIVFWSEQYISSGLAAILQATTPTFGLLFAHFMLPAEPMRWERIAGALLAAGGVGLICAKLLDFQGLHAFWGGVAIFLSAIVIAFTNVFIKASRRQFAPSVMASMQMLFALGPLLLVAFLSEGSPLRLRWTALTVGCLLYLALVGSVAAFLLYYWLLKRVPVTNLLTITLVTPPLAVALGWLVAGEKLSRWSLLGAAFVLAGVAVILRRRETPAAAIVEETVVR